VDDSRIGESNKVIPAPIGVLYRHSCDKTEENHKIPL